MILSRRINSYLIKRVNSWARIEILLPVNCWTKSGLVILGRWSRLEVARFLRNRGSQFLFWGNRATRIGGSIPEESQFTIHFLGIVPPLFITCSGVYNVLLSHSAESAGIVSFLTRTVCVVYNSTKSEEPKRTTKRSSRIASISDKEQRKPSWLLCRMSASPRFVIMKPFRN